ncbi:hypothetical protein CHS0354_019021 [Potamilus streckersoni]|uniref:Uncharacterized protein n=1 Tax=Potamilus streckersoni TaxID=2493646 RepID=A0AAE0RQI2_9BIVA|nr:hypothetical protein CHS0354_019021 [Potamilus streckersoni]
MKNETIESITKEHFSKLNPTEITPVFGMTRPGIEPMTSPHPRRTLYPLGHRSGSLGFIVTAAAADDDNSDDHIMLYCEKHEEEINCKCKSNAKGKHKTIYKVVFSTN